MLALLTTVSAFVLPGGHYRAIQGRTGPRIGFAAMKLQGREEREALEERNSIVDQPGRAGRFRDTLSNFEADADWLGFIGNRVLDAADDTLHRDRYLDDDAAPSVARKRVVVLGSGWGANAVLSQLKNTNHEVQVVSPRNYFLFTPMLAGAALGTLEPRSIIEPIREAHPKAQYFEAEASAIDHVAKTVTCESVVCEGVSCEVRSFELPYDQLIVTVGASTNTFGVKGVKEHCLFLKQLSDAVRFREQLGYAFEQASLPGLSDQQRTERLTFVIIGAGPTGVELCGELRDFVAQDVPRLYSDLVGFVRVVLLEASDKVLMAFDGDLQEAALEKLRSNAQGIAIDVRLSAGVQEVTADTIQLSDGSTIKYALALWAAGIGTLDFVKQTAEAIEAQARCTPRRRARPPRGRWPAPCRRRAGHGRPRQPPRPLSAYLVRVRARVRVRV